MEQIDRGKMPRELPGFYYDAEKNRYFPLKGRIPGSSKPSTTAAPASNRIQSNKLCKRIGVMTSKLLHGRELNGKIFGFNRGKYSFEEEFKKIYASKPVVCRYENTANIGDSALERVQLDVQTPHGLREKEILLTGSINGLLSFLEVGKAAHSDFWVACLPHHVWPPSEVDLSRNTEASRLIWKARDASFQAFSRITSIKSFRKHSSSANDGCKAQRALITTLGTETYGGRVLFVNLTEAEDIISIMEQTTNVPPPASCTIWAADYNPNVNQAAIGTNVGAALVNIETKTCSWLCRCKSDVLAQQFDQSGNLVLCGLRNGAIITVDVREKREGASSRLNRHRIPYFSSTKSSRAEWFEVKGNVYPSSTIYMPSSISCLVSLQLYDQYFLASSMDGSLKLYDHRLTKRGAVQSYEGHVNSHSRIQLGVDDSERFVMSGGEDCYLRLWSIKSGKLLFEEKFSDTVLSSISWRGENERTSSPAGWLRREEEGQRYEGLENREWYACGAWLGSQEGICHVNWS